MLVLREQEDRKPRVPYPKVWKFDSRRHAWATYASNYFQCHLDEDCRDAYADAVPNWPELTLDRRDLHELREEQSKAVAAWREHEYSGVINFATGLGKTEMALHLIHEMSCATLIVAPVRDLMYQWAREIKRAFGFEPGIIGDNTRTVRAISCTTYKSAFMHMNSLGNRFKFIVFDECHHLVGDQVANAARMSAASYRLGLSATLTAEQEHALRPFVGAVVARHGVKEAAGKQLAPYEVYRIPVTLDPSTRERYDALGKVIAHYHLDRIQDDSAFTWEILCKEARSSREAREILTAYRQRRRIEERATEKLRVVEDILELHGRTPTIIFTPSNAVAFDVSRRFLIPCILSHCKGPEREDIIEGLKSGKYPAVVANEVWDEGVNVPAAKVAICLGGRKGSRQDIQRLGRVLRRQGNQKAAYYDVFCEDTREESKTKSKRSTDAYEGSIHRRI